ncbi:MAG TPA: hypothetical protein VMX79_09330, partial [bacterium]|nr:hypothetical protein [bacterium]
DLDAVCALKELRVVKADNTISFHGRILQIPPNPYRASYAKATVEVRQLLNRQIRLYYQNLLLASFSKRKPYHPDLNKMPSLKLYRKLAAAAPL